MNGSSLGGVCVCIYIHQKYVHWKGSLLLIIPPYWPQSDPFLMQLLFRWSYEASAVWLTQIKWVSSPWQLHILMVLCWLQIYMQLRMYRMYLFDMILQNTEVHNPTSYLLPNQNWLGRNLKFSMFNLSVKFSVNFIFQHHNNKVESNDC